MIARNTFTGASTVEITSGFDGSVYDSYRLIIRSTLAAAGMLGIVGSVVGTSVGSISGSKRYTIDGNQDTFLISRQELKTLSLVGE